MTPRTSPHVESPHTILDHLATLTQSRITRDRLRIPCPAHDGTNSNLASLGQPSRHRRPLPQRRLLLRRHRQGHRGPLRHLHQPQAVPRQPHRPRPQAHERQENAGTRTKRPGPPPPRAPPLAPLSPHPQVLQPPRQEVACQPPSMEARAVSPRASALDRRRTP